MKKLWGGRFKKEMHPLLKCFSYSLCSDFNLVEEELAVNRAWAKMLGKVKLITATESKRLLTGLEAVAKELRAADPHAPKSSAWREFEDVHTLIQAMLEKKAGPVGKKIHTGRSRNDLVVTSTRMYTRKKIQSIAGKITGLQKALVTLAKKSNGAIAAGMTHLRKAQPVLVAHHLLAYVEMLEDDKTRVEDAMKRVNVLPLGSAALAGSALTIDQAFLAKELGFEKVSRNSMAAVSDRGFLAEVLSGLAILWVHLSRLSEDFILWNSEYFGFLELDDAFSTGSSLMPQKKNPDVFELVRGRAAVILGHLQTLLALQKGLPLAYNRDLQEDKPSFFDSVHKSEIALEVLALTIESAIWNPKALEKSLKDEALFATDVLEYLVRKNVPFSEAHHTVGQIIHNGLETGRNLKDIPLSEWKRFSAEFDKDIFKLFDAAQSVHGKKTAGSTNPVRIKQEIARWVKTLR